MELAIVIITFNRTEDAKAQMELIRHLWSTNDSLKKIEIFHLYNGKKEWYPKKYLEDYLIRCNNPGYYEGAALLIDTGIKKVLTSKKRFDFIVVVSADVWLTKPKVLVQILKHMKKNQLALTSSKWFFQNALSAEFFIITPNFAKKVFPLNLSKFKENHKVLSFLSQSFINKPILEICFAYKVKQTAHKPIYLLPYRKYVHWFNHRKYNQKLGYISSHDKIERGIIVKQLRLEKYGASLKNFAKTVN